MLRKFTQSVNASVKALRNHIHCTFQALIAIVFMLSIKGATGAAPYPETNHALDILKKSPSTSTYIVSSSDGRVVGIDGASGTFLWSIDTGGNLVRKKGDSAFIPAFKTVENPFLRDSNSVDFYVREGTTLKWQGHMDDLTGVPPNNVIWASKEVREFEVDHRKGFVTDDSSCVLDIIRHDITLKIRKNGMESVQVVGNINIFERDRSSHSEFAEPNVRLVVAVDGRVFGVDTTTEEVVWENWLPSTPVRVHVVSGGNVAEVKVILRALPPSVPMTGSNLLMLANGPTATACQSEIDGTPFLHTSSDFNQQPPERLAYQPLENDRAGMIGPREDGQSNNQLVKLDALPGSLGEASSDIYDVFDYQSLFYRSKVSHREPLKVADDSFAITAHRPQNVRMLDVVSTGPSQATTSQNRLIDVARQMDWQFNDKVVEEPEESSSREPPPSSPFAILWVFLGGVFSALLGLIVSVGLGANKVGSLFKRSAIQHSGSPPVPPLQQIPLLKIRSEVDVNSPTAGSVSSSHRGTESAALPPTRNGVVASSSQLQEASSTLIVSSQPHPVVQYERKGHTGELKSTRTAGTALVSLSEGTVQTTENKTEVVRNKVPADAFDASDTTSIHEPKRRSPRDIDSSTASSDRSSSTGSSSSGGRLAARVFKGGGGGMKKEKEKRRGSKRRKSWVSTRSDRFFAGEDDDDEPVKLPGVEDLSFNSNGPGSGAIRGNGFDSDSDDAYDKNSTYRNNYHEEKFIGGGGYGSVWLARNKTDSKLYAVKKIRLKDETENSEAAEENNRTKREASMHASLDHPNIARYNWSWEEDLSIKETLRVASKVEDSAAPTFSLTVPSNRADSQMKRCKHLFIAMKYYMEGSLRDWLARRKEVNHLTNTRFLLQLVEGLGHLHQNDVLHRDMKPSNILVEELHNRKHILKICDFGLSRNDFGFQGVTGGDPTEEGCNTTGVAGTPLYASPEQQTARSPYGRHSDIFSLGVIFYELFVFPYPTTQHDRIRQLGILSSKERNIPAEMLSKWSEEMQLVLDMTHPEPSERLDLAKVRRRAKEILKNYSKKARKGAFDHSLSPPMRLSSSYAKAVKQPSVRTLEGYTTDDESSESKETDCRYTDDLTPVHQSPPRVLRLPAREGGGKGGFLRKSHTPKVEPSMPTTPIAPQDSEALDAGGVCFTTPPPDVRAEQKIKRSQSCTRF